MKETKEIYSEFPSPGPWTCGPCDTFMGDLTGIYDADGTRIGFFTKKEDAEQAVRNAATLPDGWKDGIEQAAKYVDKRLADYIAEHGMYDPETGQTEFPGTGEEYVGELEEIADGIRSMLAARPAPPTQATGDSQDSAAAGGGE